jgi:hypothetical protein
MASPLLFSICLFLMLQGLRERFRRNGRANAAQTVDAAATALVVVVPIAATVGLLAVAPGYLQSPAAGSSGKWMLGGAMAAQIAVNFSIKKVIDLKV